MQLNLAGLLILQPERSWSLDALTRRVTAPRSSVHREVKRLQAAGLIEADTSIRPHAYRASTDAPAFRPLRELLELTVGVPRRLTQALSSIDEVDCAAIHGSWAAGRVRADSDVDVLVLAEGNGAAIRRAVREVGREIGREVDVSVVSRLAFRQLVDEHSPFVMKILREPFVDLVGRLEDLA